MSGDLLSNARTLNGIIQNSEAGGMEMLRQLGEEVREQFKASVMLISKAGTIIVSCPYGKEIIASQETNGGLVVDNRFSDQLRNIYETKENVTLGGYYLDGEGNTGGEGHRAVIIPIKSSGSRIGTLLLYREEGDFTQDQIVVCEYFAAVSSLLVTYSQSQEQAEAARRMALVKSAVSTLSYSELEAVIHILGELKGTEGLLVASKIADRVGITRSVIVNALRKLESAGVIESRSLGMKGTFVKVTNVYLMDEIKKLAS